MSKFFKRGALCFLLCLTFVLLAACTPNPSSFYFVYFGDAQPNPDGPGGYNLLSDLLGTSLQTAPNSAFMIFGGDEVNDGQSESEWQSFFDAFPQGFNKPLYLVPGNHTPSFPVENRLVRQPDNGPKNYPGCYSFDYGPAHILVLNSNYMYNPDINIVYEVAGWIKTDLEKSDKPWKIAVMHAPMFAAVDIDKDVERGQVMQSMYLPTLAEGGVRLILCGHQHAYSRTGAFEAYGALVQIMAVSGDKFYEDTPRWYIQKYTPNTGVYITVTVTSDKLTTGAYDSSGNCIDTITLNRGVY